MPFPFLSADVSPKRGNAQIDSKLTATDKRWTGDTSEYTKTRGESYATVAINALISLQLSPCGDTTADENGEAVYTIKLDIPTTFLR